MRRLAKLGAIAAALGILVLALWWAGSRRGSAPEGIAPTSDALPNEEEVREAPDLEPRRDEVETNPAAAASTTESERGGGETERPSGRLHVAVRLDGKAFEGATIELAAGAEPAPAIETDGSGREFETRAVSGPDGSAVIEGLPAGRYVVRASATVEDGARRAAAFVRVDEGGSSVTLELAEPQRLVFRVVDGRGAPVARAEIEVIGGGEGRNALDPGDLRTRLVCDEQGRAELDVSGLAGYVAVATAPDGRTGSHGAWRHDAVMREVESGPVDIVVGSPATLTGRVLGVAADELHGAKVNAHLVNQNQPHYTTHSRTFATEVEDGGWTFAALPAGRYTLDLSHPAGTRFDAPPLSHGRELPNSLAPIEVVLEPGEHEHVELRARPGAVLEGLVRDEHGAPFAGARVRVTFAPVAQDFPDGFVLHGAHVWRFDSPSRAQDDHPATHWRATTAADGRYRIPGLPGGRVRVEVTAPGQSYDRREAVEVVEGETTRLEHRLVRAGSILGVLPRGSYLGVRDASGVMLRVVVLPNDGQFRFDGLAPGRYGLLAVHSDERIAPVLLAEVGVRAGSESWIDLDRVARWPFRIRGVVRERGLPVAGASVFWSGRWVGTNELGQFEFGSPFPLAFPEITLRTRHRGIDVEHAVEAPSHPTGEWTCELALGLEALSVRAFDASGAPSSAKLELFSRSTDVPGIRSVAITQRTIDNGSLDVIGLVPGEYAVAVEFPDGAAARFQARLPAAAPLEVRAPPVGHITVRLLSRRGEPIPRRRITASTQRIPESAPDEPSPSSEPDEPISGFTDANGVVELRGLHAGTVVVRAHRPVEGSSWETRVTAEASLSLAQGEHATLDLIDDGP